MRRPAKVLLWVLFLLYLAVLLRITVFRTDFGSHPLFADGTVIWVPFVSLWDILQNSVPYFIYLFVGNLIWFVPFGLLIPLLTRRSSGQTILLGFALSLLIEGMQFIFGTGFTEVEDLILNTLGTAIGCCLGGLFRKVYSRKNAAS